MIDHKEAKKEPKEGETCLEIFCYFLNFHSFLIFLHSLTPNCLFFKCIHSFCFFQFCFTPPPLLPIIFPLSVCHLSTHSTQFPPSFLIFLLLTSHLTFSPILPIGFTHYRHSFRPETVFTCLLLLLP